MEKHFNEIEKNIKIISDTEKDYNDRLKSYKKVNKLIASGEKKINNYEKMLEIDDLNSFKDSHSLKVIEKYLNGEEEDSIDLDTLFEYLASIKKIRKSCT